jgi:hypothetical protein
LRKTFEIWAFFGGTEKLLLSVPNGFYFLKGGAGILVGTVYKLVGAHVELVTDKKALEALKLSYARVP